MLVLAYSSCEFLGSFVIAVVSVLGGLYVYFWHERHKAAIEARAAIQFHIYKLRSIAEEEASRQFDILKRLHREAVDGLQMLVLRAAESSGRHKQKALNAWREYFQYNPENFPHHIIESMSLAEAGAQDHGLPRKPRPESSRDVAIRLLSAANYEIQSPLFPWA